MTETWQKKAKKIDLGFSGFYFTRIFPKKNPVFLQIVGGKKLIAENRNRDHLLFIIISMDVSLLFSSVDKKMSEIKQVTARQCCSALCDNTEQLLNIGCTACENKPFAKKHYLCMECYMNLIIAAKKEKRDPVCPLDRTPIKVDKQLCRMVETDILMNTFWQEVHRTYTGVMNLQRAIIPETRLERNWGTPRRVLRRQNAVHEVVSSPDGVTNVREAMETFTPARMSFEEERQTEIREVRLTFPDITEDEENMDPVLIQQWEELLRNEHQTG